MRQFYLLLFSFLLLTQKALAQLPPPCPSNTTPPADLCGATCIYCDFNGITSTSAGYTSQTPPGGFCAGIQNEQWLGFISGCASATFIATPSNCTQGDGVQIALYSSCTSAPIACNPGMAGGGSTPMTITAGMTIGANYFLLIDGYGGDQCDLNIQVVPPMCASSPTLLPTLPINGPNSICPGGTGTFSVPVVTGAGAYIWDGPPGSTINGSPPPVTLLDPGGNNVTITFPTTPSVGVFQVCVQPVNTCNDGTVMCKSVSIAPIPPTVFPNITVCPDMLPYTLPWGDPVNTTGLYLETLTTALGCDSTLRQFVFVSPPIQTFLPAVFICAGQTYSVCGTPYTDAGTYSQVCQAANGCDSTVNFTILVSSPMASINASGSLGCNATTVTLTANPSPGTFSWSLNGTQVGVGPIYQATQPGTYLLTVSTPGAIVCTDTASYTISGSTSLPNVSIANPAAITCSNTTSTLTASSTTPGATFAWTGGPATATYAVGSPGTYTVVATNPANGCTSSSSVVVTGNATSPSASAAATVITCASPSASLTASSNATGATFAWSNSTSGSTTTVSATGIYTVTITNPTNGCTATANTNVSANTNQPDVSASSAVISCNTPSANLTAISTQANVTFAWSNGISGATNTVTTPNTYTVVVTSPTNGCTASATATASADLSAPGATATGGTLSCTITQINLASTSPASGVTYTWTGPGGFNSTQQNPVANAQGSYTVVITSAINGCTSSATALVASNTTPPSASATGGVISCSASSTMLAGSSSTSPVSYAWFDTGTPPTLVATGQNPSVTTPGVYVLVVTNTNNGCTNTATATVVPSSDVPNVSVTSATITCTNASVTITGSSTTPGVSVAWSDPSGNPLGTAAAQTVSTAGIYTFVVTNPANGCTAVGSAVVSQNITTPNVTATGGALTCLSGNLQLSASSTTPGVVYAWSAPGFSSMLQNPTISTAGTYTVVATNPSNGCTGTASAVVSADTNAPTVMSNTGTLTCATNSINLVGTATGPSPIQTYVWTLPDLSTSSGSSLQANLPGNYVLEVTAQNGCTATFTAIVGQDVATPGANTTVSGVLGCSVTSVTLAATSATTGVAYNWSNNQTTASINTASAGTYTVTVTASANGCSSTSSVQVQTSVAFPVLNIAAPQTLTCSNTSSPLNLTATIVGVASIDTYQWSNTLTTEDIDATAPGIYTVTVTGNNGCSTTATASVTQNITQPNASATGGTLTCTATSALLSGISTTPMVTWAWAGPGISPANMNLQNPSVTSAGTYTLTVTGTNGCTTTATATIVPDAGAPTGTISASANTLTCSINSALLSVNSATTGLLYRWANQATPATVLGNAMALTVNSPGVYAVTLTATNGCTAVVLQNITQNILVPSVATLNDSLDCFTGVANLVASSTTPGVTYQWTGPGNTMGNTASISVTNQGVYSVIVTDPLNGCSSTGTAEAIPNATSPDATISSLATELTCTLTSIALTGTSTTPGVSVAWTGPGGFNSMNSIITANAPGIFQYDVTAPNGCKTTKSITITQNILPPAGVTAQSGTLTCSAPMINLAGNSTTPSVTYAWAGPGGFTSAAQNPTVTVGGTYILTITGTNGCSITASTTVLVNQTAPDVTAIATTSVLTCTTPSTVLDASTNTTGVTWQWTGVSPQISTLEDPTTTTGGTYQVVATAPNGCTNSAQVTVTVDQLSPMASASGGTLTCDMPTIPITGSSATLGVTYQWFLNGVPVSNQQNPNVNQVGNYQLVVTAPNGCTQTAIAAVIPDAGIPTLNVSGGLITCAITSVTLDGSSNQPVTWLWTGPGINATNATVSSPTVSLPGTYQVTITLPSNGCTVNSTVVVLQNIATPSVQIAAPPLLDCNTSEVSLIATVAGSSSYTFNWTSQNGNIVSGANSSVAAVSQAGQYNLLVTDQVNGCTTTISEPVLLDQNIPQTPSAVVQGVRCFGESNGSIIMGDVTGGAPPYLFSIDGGPFGPTNNFAFLPPGQHVVVLQDANGCEVETIYTVTEPSQLGIDIGPDITIRLGEIVQVNFANLAQYLSDPARADTFFITPANADTILCDTCVLSASFRYTVMVQDINGCRAIDDRLIIVDGTRSVVIPNVFNPFSTQNNDVLTVFGGIDVERVKDFKVFDRWGNQVFGAADFDISDNFQNGWDGKFRSKSVAPGVYVYVVEVKFKDGATEFFKGDVTILR